MPPLPQSADIAARSGLLAAHWFERLDARLAASAFVAADRFTIADITAMVTVDFARWVKLGIPEAHAHTRRWYGRGRGAAERAGVTHRPGYRFDTFAIIVAEFDKYSQYRQSNRSVEGNLPMTDVHRPKGLSSALSYLDAKAAYRWLETAFGFEPLFVILDADGNLAHSEMSFGDAVVMVGNEWSDDHKSPKSIGGRNTQSVHVPARRGRGHRRALRARACRRRDHPAGARDAVLR